MIHVAGLEAIDAGQGARPCLIAIADGAGDGQHATVALVGGFANDGANGVSIGNPRLG
jgi:hypothetical protein